MMISCKLFACYEKKQYLCYQNRNNRDAEKVVGTNLKINKFMKKFFIIALAAMSLSFTMVSCKSAEEKKCTEYVDQINKCLEGDDTAGAIKAADELQEWMNGLNDDQKKSLKDAIGADGESALETLLGMVNMLKSLQ